MKANEAPDKIWVHELSAKELNVPLKEYHIEYTRTDSFIEKACDAYCKVCGHYPHTVPTHICRHDCSYFSDFKNYIKGE